MVETVFRRTIQQEVRDKLPGILLLAGSGSRLSPLTSVVNKHFLPIYDKPMALHALEFLQESGIKKIVVITNPEEVDLIAELFDSYKQANTELLYIVQDKPLGTAHAIKLSEKLVTEKSFFTLWGDNIFEYNLRSSVQQELVGKCRLHLTRISNPQEFGVLEIDEKERIISIEDKPEFPKSNTICTGFMGFNSEVFGMFDKIKPNVKGELDIMDIVRIYQVEKMLEYVFIKGSWLDAGVSFETLFAAAILAKEKGLNKTYEQA